MSINAAQVGDLVSSNGSRIDPSVALRHTQLVSVSAALALAASPERDALQSLIAFIMKECSAPTDSGEEAAATTGWLASVPASLRSDLCASVNYLMMLVAIDFRHWGENDAHPEAIVGQEVRQENFYAVVDDDESSATQHKESGNASKLVRGSAAMIYLLRRAVDKQSGPIRWYDPHTIVSLPEAQLESIFWGVKGDGVNPMIMPATKERMALLREMAKGLLQRKTSFFQIVTGFSEKDNDDISNVFGGIRLYNKGQGLLEQLVALHRRYDDSSDLEYTDPAENSKKICRIHFFKLAQLSVIAIQNAFPGRFVVDDIDLLGVCSDYQLPKALRAAGLIVYDDTLSKMLEQRVLLGVNSREEVEIRASSTIAAKSLQVWVNANLGPDSVQCTVGLMDYALWYFGRSNMALNHHLCRTVMY